jgi:putative transposase
MKKRKWTAQEKLGIIQEAEVQGVTATIRKHGIYSNTYYGWKEKYDAGGFEALKNHGKSTGSNELKALQEENRKLKELLAERDLTIRVKDELLKKTQSQNRSK